MIETFLFYYYGIKLRFEFKDLEGGGLGYGLKSALYYNISFDPNYDLYDTYSFNLKDNYILSLGIFIKFTKSKPAV